MIASQLQGKVFGRLTVLERAGKSKNGHSLWLCQCECGKNTIVFGSNLKRKHTESCGCLNDEVITKHGVWGCGAYRTWHCMMQRCTNPKHKRYSYYGGRGIAICSEWREDFRNFYRDMGDRPEGLTLDRIDADKGYYKENCKWATLSEQNYNTRRSINKMLS